MFASTRPQPSYYPKKHASGAQDHPQKGASSAVPDPRHYSVSVHRRRLNQFNALVDRGANGSIIGGDMRVVTPQGGFTHLNGIDDHAVRNLQIVQAGGVVRTNRGPVILIVNQGAHMPDGKTILSPGQFEHYGWTVNEKSPRVTGVQPTMTSVEGYVIPLEI